MFEAQPPSTDALVDEAAWDFKAQQRAGGEWLYELEPELRVTLADGSQVSERVGVSAEVTPFELEIEGPVEVHTRALGTTDIERIELVTPAGVAASEEPKSPSVSFVGEVEAAYVYCRVTQADGEMAWSSPIFFTPQGAS